MECKRPTKNEPITPNVHVLNVPDDYCTYNVVKLGNLSKCNTKQSIFCQNEYRTKK